MLLISVQAQDSPTAIAAEYGGTGKMMCLLIVDQGDPWKAARSLRRQLGKHVRRTSRDQARFPFNVTLPLLATTVRPSASD